MEPCWNDKPFCPKWSRIFELEIVPHPSLKHPKTIETNYGMENGVLNIYVRAATAGYALRRFILALIAAYNDVRISL